MNLHNSLPD